MNKTKLDNSRLLFISFLVGCVVFLQRCGRGDTDGVLSPEASIRAMEVVDGFEVKLVAAEPLVVAPVAMTFDDQGRSWVAEMDGYMPDTLGTGEEAPVGRIVILDDDNGDGKMDNRTVFLDSLVMPRALCLVGGGLLVAAPPNLWFYDIRDDRPVRKTLVDSTYAEGGNVEHQPNGLLRGLDNWIYSAKYDWRYRRSLDGTWRKEKTHFRGQWGISHDNWGRLYYNDNSSNLSGDYFSPGLGAGNPNQRRVAGYNETIVKDTRVYPIHPTTGVNRGYMDGILDSTGRLLNFTAACGPLVYRGGLISGLNAFVAEPAANLIKQNVLREEGFRVMGKQAFEEREFLASSDERFRPVNLYDGPDGALYILDMYRGIIQHSTYLTPYLKDEIAKRDLTLPLSMGRIYKVVPKGTRRTPVRMPLPTDSLITLLGHPNGWVRDMAQRTLVDRKALDAIEPLRKMLRSSQGLLQTVHALWTLEGLDALTLADLQPLISREHPISSQVFAAVAGGLNEPLDAAQVRVAFANLEATSDTLLLSNYALLLATINSKQLGGADPSLIRLAHRFPDNPYVADAVISGFANREEELIARLTDTATTIYRRLGAIVAAKKGKTETAQQAAIQHKYKQGVTLFQTACQPCHGEDGRGVSPIAPPLAGSEWVKGNKERLIALVLYGLTGPVDVAGHTYETPEVSGEMPGIVHNQAISRADLAELLSYIRNAWGNGIGDEVLPEDLGTIRQRFGSRTDPFTQDELRELFGKD